MEFYWQDFFLWFSFLRASSVLSQTECWVSAREEKAVFLLWGSTETWEVCAHHLMPPPTPPPTTRLFSSLSANSCNCRVVPEPYQREKRRKRLREFQGPIPWEIHTSKHAIYIVSMYCSNAQKTHSTPNVGRSNNSNPFTSCSQRNRTGESEMRQNDAKSKPHLVGKRHL